MTEFTNYCLGFAFDSPDPRTTDGIHTLPQVGLIRKIKPTWQAGSLNGIGGTIEESDRGDGASRAGLNAMVREFEEETGLRTVHNDWRCFHTMGNERWQVECYRAFHMPLSLLKTTTEEEVLVISALYLPHDVLWNLRWLIPLALDHQPLPAMQVYR